MTLTQPPILRGSVPEQLQMIRQYLYRISNDLNTALSEVETYTAPAMAKPAGTPAASGDSKMPTGLSELKSLIIKTAGNVRAEINVLETKLHSTYVAQSDFGTFTEAINTTVRDTAERMDRVIEYQSALSDTVGGLNSDFAKYVTDTTGYIRQGIIAYQNGIPIIGIAIGQDIRVRGSETVDGKEYAVIDTTSNVSTWTPERLTFYVSGREAAYVSKGAFYAPILYVTGTFHMGGEWEISHGNGFAVKWTGGNA